MLLQGSCPRYLRSISATLNTHRFSLAELTHMNLNDAQRFQLPAQEGRTFIQLGLGCRVLGKTASKGSLGAILGVMLRVPLTSTSFNGPGLTAFDSTSQPRGDALCNLMAEMRAVMRELHM